MLVITGTLRFAEECIEEARAAMAEVGKTTRENDEGCIIYSFSQDIDEPGLFRVYEEWENSDNLKAHGQAEHMAAFQKKLKGLKILGADIKLATVEEFKPLR